MIITSTWICDVKVIPQMWKWLKSWKDFRNIRHLNCSITYGINYGSITIAMEDWGLWWWVFGECAFCESSVVLSVALDKKQAL